MDDTLIATPGWAGHERRLGERRITVMSLTEERRAGRDRRATVALTPPARPMLALHGSQALRERDGADAWVPGDGDGEPDAIPSVASIAGHPIHPMLVPLPIGALALSVVSDLAFAASDDRFFARASRVLTGVGIATGLGAAAAGALDFLGRERVRDHPAAWLHAAGNIAAVGLSAASFAARARARDTVPPAAMALSGAVGVLLLATGWLGGELAYRHRVGVMPEPTEPGGAPHGSSEPLDG